MEQRPGLQRGLSTTGALGANIIDMVGVGPFITLPLIIAAMGGPQAMLGWVLGAALSLCDGMTWSELGTAHPEAGGSYAYLKASYPPRWGRMFSFLYAWQLLFSAPLSIASGCIGFAQYLGWFHPSLSRTAHSLIAMAACIACTAILLQPVRRIGQATRALGIVVILTLLAVIVIGLTHFHAAQAFSFPGGAFHLDGAFFMGLGSGLLIAVYDYWGYYNACFLGAEIQTPQRTIPRAVLGSIVIVGALYLLMNVAVLGVLPWQSLAGEGAAARQYTIAAFVQTAFASHAWAAHSGQRSCGLHRAGVRCVRVRVALRLFAHPVRCRARWQLPTHLCPSPCEEPCAHHLAACAVRRDVAVLHAAVAGSYRLPGGGAHRLSVPAAGRRRDAAKTSRGTQAARTLPHAAVSAAHSACHVRLRLRPALAPEALA